MKFERGFLLGGEWDKTVYDKITGRDRWTIHYETVFQHNGKFYKTEYGVGATEHQEEIPYEYDPDEIECPEVFPVETMVTVYKEKELV